MLRNFFRIAPFLITLTSAILVAGPTAAEEPPAPSFDYASMEARAAAYFAAYERLDVGAMAESYHPEVLFLDETAEAIGPAYRMSGKEEIRAAFEGFMPNIQKLRIELEEKYFSGSLGVFRGIYHARVKGGAVGRSQDELFDVDYPFITVLEFKDGLVSKHIDYIDYQKMAQRLPELEPVAAGAP